MNYNQNNNILNIDKEILEIDSVICENITSFNVSSERGLLSQNILSQLRNFVEIIITKESGQIEISNYKCIKKSINYIKKQGELNFLYEFHKLLQISSSHYTKDKNNSEILILDYLKYLYKIKSHLKKKYNLDVLANIKDFLTNNDNTQQEYYKKVIEKINFNIDKKPDFENQKYYIEKIKPIFVESTIYYEITFTIADDYISKFDKFIAFSKLDMLDNYAVKFSIIEDEIKINDILIPIMIINNWHISIRNCEIKNFISIFKNSHNIKITKVEYDNLMFLLTELKLNLLEIVQLSDDSYMIAKNLVTKDNVYIDFFKILDESRELIKNKSPGSNVIRYLLFNFHNRIIKSQIKYEVCSGLSNLYLNWGCKTFDELPFSSSLIGHNLKIFKLIKCIDTRYRGPDIFASFIKNNTEHGRCLYTPEINMEVSELIKNYNDSLYRTHKETRAIKKFKKHIYIEEYEQNTIEIIKYLKDLSIQGVEDYEKSVIFWLNNLTYNIDCEEKKEIVKKIFEKSKVAFIYGSAGTGKSTLINHISQFFNDKNKLYLANTHAALNNLERKIITNKSEFYTIKKFLSKNQNCKYSLLFIDECSTVSNQDMAKILKNVKFELLILVGDIYQIKSIIFGNWFGIAKKLISQDAIFELEKPYRTEDKKLLKFWKSVRINKNDISTSIINYTSKLDNSIFERDSDEIALCLNYSGIYGINSLNRILQKNNKNKYIKWDMKTYKIDDPILFNETYSNRFAPLIYSNCKGRIIDFEEFKEEKKIRFDIELIDKVINQIDLFFYQNLELIPNADKNKSTIRFFVNKHKNSDEDNNSKDNIVPFQVAYAISIHKSQGLEYNSVKIVISNDVEEIVTHDIFYTAITRSREKLKIYCTPENINKIINNFNKTTNYTKDANLLLCKMKERNQW